MVKFSVEFQSDSINDGRASEGWIFTIFVSVKYSRVVVASLLLQCVHCAVLAMQLTTMSFE